MAEITYIEYEAQGIDLPGTLFCGQSFSWREAAPGVYRGAAGQRAAEVCLANGLLRVQPLTPVADTAAEREFWRGYFALDEDYPALLQKFSQNKRLAACVAHTPGMRVLRQPFWDTLLSFIISQNNNLGRITGIVSRLREGFGDELGGGERAFPTPERLAACTVEDLAPLRAGFRAKYLIDAAQRVATDEVSEAALRQAADEDARLLLCRIHGVGTKVADCVLLYGLHRRRVAPMDVWMKRAMEQTFPKGMPRPARGHEGIAQQYIFCWARDNL